MPDSPQDNDAVFPKAFFDTHHLIWRLAFTQTFVINDVLDPRKMHDAATRLLEIPSWRHLGGRLRMNVRLTRLPTAKTLRVPACLT
jgi:hypothetical protein